MISQTQNITEKFKSESWKLFDEISPRYDFLNRLLSLGQDLKWRERLAWYLPSGENLKVLDVATGTADVLLEIAKADERVMRACGIDLAKNMLELGRKKVEQNGLTNIIELKPGDANQIPFPDQSFDVVTIAFGIRNMSQPQKVLLEMFRVLKDGGRILVLEFSLAQNFFIRALQLFYLRVLVPTIGFIFSGHFRAYKYLNQTIESFPYGPKFLSALKDCGFAELIEHPLMHGAATIYQGNRIKPAKECPWVC